MAVGACAVWEAELWVRKAVVELMTERPETVVWMYSPAAADSGKP